jgi:hypothetical protein
LQYRLLTVTSFGDDIGSHIVQFTVQQPSVVPLEIHVARILSHRQVKIDEDTLFDDGLVLLCWRGKNLQSVTGRQFTVSLFKLEDGQIPVVQV